jgi:hypothetical protein
MPDDEKEPDIERTRKDVTIYAVTAEAIAEALPPTISIEDKEATAEYIVKLLKQQKEEIRKEFEEKRRKREKEHEEVVKALDEEREGRKTEHEEAVKWNKGAVKWRRISIAFAVISVLLALSRFIYNI